MRLDCRHPRQCAFDGFTGGVEFHKAMRLTPLQRSAYAPAHPSGHLRLGAPDRCQDSQNILPANAVNPYAADPFERMHLQLPYPVRRRLVGSPAWTKRLMGAPGRLAEHGDSCLTLGCQRVAAASREPAVLECGLPRFRERDQSAAAEPEVVAFSANGQALNPLLGAAGRDSEKESAAVAVKAWFIDCAHLLDGQFSLSHVYFSLFITLFIQRAGANYSAAMSPIQEGIILYTAVLIGIYGAFCQFVATPVEVGLAPRAGLEPATNWLTANRSTY